MYESPIQLLVTDIQQQINAQMDDEIYKAVVHFIPNINRAELLRALQYDRDQYDKGYTDGKAAAKEDLIQCKDCVHWQEDDDVGYCTNPDGLDNYAKPNDFCSYGERRESDATD